LRRFVAQLSDAELERRTGATKLAAVGAAVEANPQPCCLKGIEPTAIRSSAIRISRT